MSQLRRLIENLTMHSEVRALESAAVTAAFLHASLSFLTWRISKTQTDACTAAATLLYHCTEKGRGGGGLFALTRMTKGLKPPRGSHPHPPHTHNQQANWHDSPSLFSKYWRSHSTPLPPSQGTLVGRRVWSGGSSWEAVVAKVWCNQHRPWSS